MSRLREGGKQKREKIWILCWRLLWFSMLDWPVLPMLNILVKGQCTLTANEAVPMVWGAKALSSSSSRQHPEGILVQGWFRWAGIKQMTFRRKDNTAAWRASSMVCSLCVQVHKTLMDQVRFIHWIYWMFHIFIFCFYIFHFLFLYFSFKISPRKVL